MAMFVSLANEPSLGRFLRLLTTTEVAAQLQHKLSLKVLAN